MRKTWIGVVLAALLMIAATAPAFADSGFVPFDDPLLQTQSNALELYPADPVTEPEKTDDSFIEYGDEQDIYPIATPEPTKAPVQDQGIITLESRRTFGGELFYTINEMDHSVEWSAGVAYTDSPNRLGALRHVWVFSEDPSVEVLSFEYDYELTKDGDSATFTLTFAIMVEDQEYTYRELFRVTPDGESARAEPMFQGR